MKSRNQSCVSFQQQRDHEVRTVVTVGEKDVVAIMEK
jgi:hypothetical protein